MNVAVVGAGIHGACTALELVTRGHDVTLLDQFEPMHSRGSSHGNSRIVRYSYPDPYYTDIMREGYPLWGEMERRTRTRFLHECGLLYFGKEDSPNLAEVRSSLEANSVMYRTVDRNSVEEVFPALRLSDGQYGIFTGDGGWVDADKARAAILELFRSCGGSFRVQEVRDLDGLRTFDSFVLCVGAWIKQFVDVPVRVTLQTFAYVSGVQAGPVWIEDSDINLYGFPTEPGAARLKIGVHRPGREIEPSINDRSPSAEDVWLIREGASRLFGFDAEVSSAQGCLYTSTASEDFILDRVGDRGFFASPCSGHGFKFAPWIGRRLADFIEDKREPSEFPRFCLRSHYPAS